MRKSLSLPAWFKGLLEKGKDQAATVATGFRQGFCPHWDKQETVWAHAADPENRKVMHRQATCILCGRIEKPASWKGFKVNIPGPAAREAMLLKAGIRE